MTPNALAREGLMSERAIECPFCGLFPEIVPWHGGPKSKRRVQCRNELCTVEPGVCGNTRAKAVRLWNTRADDRP